ncbi:MAG: decaprenyl-phosphate phosphoribosyltransferase, partial [Actinomycetota bacterium]
MSVGAHVREARPKQWAKNVLVVAAPGAAGVLNEWSSLWQTLVAFAALCLAASGTYYWNDIKDVEAD